MTGKELKQSPWDRMDRKYETRMKKYHQKRIESIQDKKYSREKKYCKKRVESIGGSRLKQSKMERTRDPMNSREKKLQRRWKCWSQRKKKAGIDEPWTELIGERKTKTHNQEQPDEFREEH